MNTLLTHPLVVALATTLLHSLWMFCVLTGLGWWLAGVAEEARHRYVIFLGTLLSFPATFLIVLYLELRVTTAAWSDAVLIGESLGVETTRELTSGLSKLGIATQPDWLSYLAACYLIGLIVSLAISCYRYGVSVKMRRGGWLAPPALRRIFNRLKQEITPGKRVEWQITKRVSQALAVGILRPFILFPVGLINALTPEEVEVVLRHELTHLRRADPLWNALQELIVSLFFYHPLVYFLSRRIDREREYACDDAVTAGTDKSTYAHALVRAAKFSLHPKTPFTMAANDNSNFSQRIQRLFSTDQRSVTTQGRSYLLAPLAIVPFFLLFAFAPGGAAREAWSDVEAAAPIAKEWIVKGTVTNCDTGDPLIGTAIMIKGTNSGTITDLDGAYKLRVPEGPHTITYSYSGYEPMATEINMTKNHYSDIAMCEGKAGKATVRATIEVFDLEVQSVGDDVANGSTKLMGALESEILLLVDGERIIAGTMDDISPDSIEAVEVLKDKKKIAALGFGSDFKGAILVTLRK